MYLLVISIHDEREWGEGEQGQGERKVLSPALIPVNTRDTTVRVHGLVWVRRIWYRTRTRVTRDPKPAGFHVPLEKPTQAQVDIGCKSWDQHSGMCLSPGWDL